MEKLLRIDKQELIRLLRLLGGEWIISSTFFGCRPGHSKVYLKRKLGKSGGLKISECLPNDEVKRLKDELREYLKRSLQNVFNTY